MGCLWNRLNEPIFMAALVFRLVISKNCKRRDILVFDYRTTVGASGTLVRRGYQLSTPSLASTKLPRSTWLPPRPKPSGSTCFTQTRHREWWPSSTTPRTKDMTSTLMVCPLPEFQSQAKKNKGKYISKRKYNNFIKCCRSFQGRREC